MTFKLRGDEVFIRPTDVTGVDGKESPQPRLIPNKNDVLSEGYGLPRSPRSNTFATYLMSTHVFSLNSCTKKEVFIEWTM